MKKMIVVAFIALFIASCSKPYVIVQVADAQLGFTASDICNKEGRPYDNDVTYEVECLTKAVAMINEIRPDAVVFTGDQVHHANNQHEWTAFIDAISGISKEVKLFHVPGNHDVLISGNSVDISPFAQHLGEGTFIHKEKSVKFVGINSNLIKYNDPNEEAQVEWLKSNLTKKNKEVTLVFAHHPFFLDNIDEGEGYFPIQKDKRKKYFDIFKANDVDAVYTGHLHNNAGGEYEGIPSKTATSVAYQIGDAQPSIRVITIQDGKVSDELVPLS